MSGDRVSWLTEQPDENDAIDAEIARAVEEAVKAERERIMSEVPALSFSHYEGRIILIEDLTRIVNGPVGATEGTSQ